MLLAGSLCYMDALVTRQEAADILQLSVQRVRQLEASGQLTKFKNKRTGRVQLSRDEVLELKRSQETWDAVAVHWNSVAV